MRISGEPVEWRKPAALEFYVDFETGTTIHFRFAPPKSRREQALARDVGAVYGEALRSSLPSLITQLQAESAARTADRGPEPELAVPKPDGPLARIQPLVIVR